MMWRSLELLLWAMCKPWHMGSRQQKKEGRGSMPKGCFDGVARERRKRKVSMALISWLLFRHNYNLISVFGSL